MRGARWQGWLKVMQQQRFCAAKKYLYYSHDPSLNQRKLESSGARFGKMQTKAPEIWPFSCSKPSFSSVHCVGD